MLASVAFSKVGKIDHKPVLVFAATLESAKRRRQKATGGVDVALGQGELVDGVTFLFVDPESFKT